MSREPRFELHIRPMFRMIDRDHMAFAFDLHDSATYYKPTGEPKIEFAKEVAKYLTGESTPQMPTLASGGPWPQEWIDLFQRWIDADCPRLQPATGQFTAMRLADSVVRLSATVEVPSTDYEAWFERENTGIGTWEYSLYMDAENPQSGPPSTKFLGEQIVGVPPTTTSILVHDATGSQSVTIEGSP